MTMNNIILEDRSIKELLTMCTERKDANVINMNDEMNKISKGISYNKIAALKYYCTSYILMSDIIEALTKGEE